MLRWEYRQPCRPYLKPFLSRASMCLRQEDKKPDNFALFYGLCNHFNRLGLRLGNFQPRRRLTFRNKNSSPLFAFSLRSALPYSPQPQVLPMSSGLQPQAWTLFRHVLHASVCPWRP